MKSDLCLCKERTGGRLEEGWGDLQEIKQGEGTLDDDLRSSRLHVCVRPQALLIR